MDLKVGVIYRTCPLHGWAQEPASGGPCSQYSHHRVLQHLKAWLVGPGGRLGVNGCLLGVDQVSGRARTRMPRDI